MFHYVSSSIYDVSSKHLENNLYCSLREVVGDSRRHQGKALTAPRGHHGTSLGMPRTHERHSSKHTWAPRHVWCAPCDRNSTGPDAIYLLLA